MAEILKRKHDLNMLSECSEIPAHIAVMIHFILLHEFEITSRKEEVLKTVAEEKYREVEKQSTVLQYLKYCPILKEMKEKLWNSCSVDILGKIIESKIFVYSPGRWEKEFIIPDCVLPRFNSFDTFNRTDPKGAMAGKLGAKLV